MGYREVKVDGATERLRIEPGHMFTTVFDIDHFGLDDGLAEDPTASMRALFQLGSGYMIYLYVIGMRQPGEGPWFHTFWVKACVAVEIEMEEYGPPSLVSCDTIELPRVYATVSIAGARSMPIARTTFHAAVAEAQQTLLLRFELGGDYALEWSSAAGWTAIDGQRHRVLDAGERVVFRE